MYTVLNVKVKALQKDILEHESYFVNVEVVFVDV